MTGNTLDEMPATRGAAEASLDEGEGERASTTERAATVPLARVASWSVVAATRGAGVP